MLHLMINYEFCHNSILNVQIKFDLSYLHGKNDGVHNWTVITKANICCVWHQIDHQDIMDSSL